MIRLFLENHEVELDKSVQFAITKTFEDITSPADIKNDWSKTVEIPFTQHNNKIFGMLFSTDRLIVEGSSKLMGVYFNPYKKVDFRLQWGSAIIMQGYAKNINVIKTATGGHYNITLNGELGKVFQEMKKITFDTTTDDKTYLIDGAKYVNETINKELVYNLWSNEASLDIDLKEKTNSDYELGNIINFAPNNSFDNDFKYNLYQYINRETNDENLSKTFAATLDDKAKIAYGENASYESIVGINADTIIGKGLLPREIGEYRSWLQLPYIYFNKLFQIFLKKTEEITGYGYELDANWFNSDNPYWGKLVYMLKRLFSDRENEGNKTTKTKQITGVALVKSGGNWKTFTSWLNETNADTQNRLYEERKNVFDTSLDTEILIVNEKRNQGVWYGIANNAGIEVEIAYYDKIQNEIYNTCKYLLISPTSTLSYNKNQYSNVIEVPNVKDDVLCAKFIHASSSVGQSYLTYRWRFIGEDNTFFFFNSDSNSTQNSNSSTWVGGDIRVGFGVFDKYSTIGNAYWTVNNGVVEEYDNILHTNYNFTLNDLWDNEFNLFDEILDYCKMYRIGIFCDNINKKLIFKPLSEYFKEYKVLDWTDKLDMSKEYHIQPITFENKYLLFNYKGIDSKLNNTYKEKYGVNYGEYKLSTNYEFNTDVKELFKGINNSICNTDSVLSWTNLYDNLTFIYTIPKEIMVYNKDKDDKNVSVFGCMYIYNGLTQFDKSNTMRSVKLSDDTRLQEISREFFYSQNVNTTSNIETYPYLNVKDTYNICLFNKPCESYIYPSNYFEDTVGIYNNFWENYLNERYNKQNKIVTCYLRLTPYDIANFKYNNFVKIENQLYFVNKIYDYCIDENVSTKVDLITIQDISGYTESNFRIFNIYFKVGNNYELYDKDWHYLDIDQHTSQTIYITSNVDVEWQTDSGLQNNVEVNGEVVSGVIKAGNKVPVTLFNDEYGPVEGYIEFNNGKNIQKIFVRVR